MNIDSANTDIFNFIENCEGGTIYEEKRTYH